MIWKIAFTQRVYLFLSVKVHIFFNGENYELYQIGLLMLG